MTHNDTLRYTPNDDHWIKNIMQCYALAIIYFSTNGLGWAESLFFLNNYNEYKLGKENS